MQAAGNTARHPGSRAGAVVCSWQSGQPGHLLRVELVLAQGIVNDGWASMDSGPAPKVLDRQGTAQQPEPTAPGRVYLDLWFEIILFEVRC